MRKVLIVSHFFAQCRHFRSTRISGLAKYLPEYGWDPVILTSDAPKDLNGDYEVVEARYEDYLKNFKGRLGLRTDQPMKDQVDQDKPLKRNMTDLALTTWERIYGFPDPTLSWVGPAVEAGKRILSRGDIKAIISSSGPGASHIVANKLKAELDVPWIADLRDLWSWDHNDVRSPIRRLMNEKLERETLLSADVLTTVSEPLAQKLKEIHKKEVRTITNGFDPDDMFSQPVVLDEKFSINYTGKVYRKGMDPAPLFETLEFLISSSKINPKNVVVNFYGDGDPWFKREIDDHQLEGIVRVHGAVPRHESLDIQKRSQMLLILGWDNEKERGVYTGKVFDYLAANRPILSIGSSTDVISELLVNTRAGQIATNCDELIGIILSSYREFMTDGQVAYKGDMGEVMKYSHKEMARSFSGLLNSR